MSIITNLVQYYLNAVIFLSLTVYILILYFDIEKLSKNSKVFISDITEYSQFAIFVSVFYMFRFFFLSTYVQENLIVKWIILIALGAFLLLFLFSIRIMIIKNYSKNRFMMFATIFSTVVLLSFAFEHEYILYVYNAIIFGFSLVSIMFCIKLIRRKIAARSYGLKCLLISSFILFLIRVLPKKEFVTVFLNIDTCLALFALLGLFLVFTYYADEQREGYIASLEAKNSTIQKMYYYDEIVECDNFRAFENEIKDIRKNDYVLIMNVRKFMAYNNLMGYAGGDELLRRIAIVLKKVLPSNYGIYRSYADKFIIWCKDDDFLNISEYIDLIYQSLNEDQTIGYKVQVYFGITKYQGEKVKDEGIESKLVKELEVASSLANERKLISYEITEWDMVSYEKKINLQNNLPKAIKDHAFIVHYQPQVEKYSKKVISMEALVRWEHKEEIIPPGYFIDYAEENGYILDITKQVVKQVLNDINYYQFMKEIKISINISPVHLIEEEFYQFFKSMISEYDVNPKQIVLELTENVLINDMEQVVEGIQRIKDIGVQFSLDDFGTGYSSLHRFISLSFDEIKFDRCFIDEMKNKEDLEEFVKLVDYFKSSDMRIVIEGVETENQVDLLENTPIDIYQGYYFYKPKPIDVLQGIFIN